MPIPKTPCQIAYYVLQHACIVRGILWMAIRAGGGKGEYNIYISLRSAAKTHNLD